MRASLEDIPAGDAGLRVKLQRLRGLVDAAVSDPSFVALARRVIEGVPERDYLGEVRAVSAFVRRMRYTRDPAGVELFTDPRILAAKIAAGQPAHGDCDDASGLGAALVEAIGHPARFRVGGFRGREPGVNSWAHIWTEVLVPRRGWLPLDDTAKMRPPGWDPAPKFEVTLREAPPMMRRQVVHPAPVRYGGAVSLADLPWEYGGMEGLAGFSLKKAFKKVKKVAPKPARKLVSKAIKVHKKTVRPVIKKALPIAAVAVNVVPGIGQVASVALAAAATASRAYDMRKAAKKAEQQMRAEEAAYAAEVAAQGQQQIRVDSLAPPSMIEPDPYAQAQQTGQFIAPGNYVMGGGYAIGQQTYAGQPNAAAYAYPTPVQQSYTPPQSQQYLQPYYAPQPSTAYAPQQSYQSAYGYGSYDPYAYSWGQWYGVDDTVGLAFDWGGLLNNVMNVAPQVISAAQSGAFGSRVAKNVGRITGQVQQVTQQPAVQQVLQDPAVQRVAQQFVPMLPPPVQQFVQPFFPPVPPRPPQYGPPPPPPPPQYGPFPQQQQQTPSWVMPAAIAGGALLLVLAMRR